MNARSLISLIVTVAVVSAAAVVWNAADADARSGRNTRGAHRHQAMMEALDLTAEQQEKLKSIQLNNAKRMTRLKADLKIARLDLQDLLSQSNPNPAQVKIRVVEVNRVRSEMLEKKIDFRLAQKKVFTPEQLEKVQELKRERPRRRGRRWRGRHGRPGVHQGPGPHNQPGPSTM